MGPTPKKVQEKKNLPKVSSPTAVAAAKTMIPMSAISMLVSTSTLADQQPSSVDLDQQEKFVVQQHKAAARDHDRQSKSETSRLTKASVRRAKSDKRMGGWAREKGAGESNRSMKLRRS